MEDNSLQALESIWYLEGTELCISSKCYGPTAYIAPRQNLADEGTQHSWNCENTGTSPRGKYVQL